jgi:hypothetical protein
MLRLALLFMLATSNAWANWVAIGKSPDFTMYVDPQSLQRNGNIATAWIMGDYSKTQKKRFPPPILWVEFDSIKELKQFDCSKGAHRTEKTVIMSGKFGKGDPLYTFTSVPDYFPVPNSELDIAQFNYVCTNAR